MHLITDHIAEYLNIPDGTGNLLDMSSSGLESSNKTERFLIHLRSVSWDCNSFKFLAYISGCSRAVF